MARTTKRNTTPGFAIEIKDDTELGLAMLVAEDEGGRYQPVGCVSSISEAREIAQSDFRRRMHDLEGGAGPSLCPCVYKVWAAGRDGDYRTVAELPATSL